MGRLGTRLAAAMAIAVGCGGDPVQGGATDGEDGSSTTSGSGPSTGGPATGQTSVTGPTAGPTTAPTSGPTGMTASTNPGDTTASTSDGTEDAGEEDPPPTCDNGDLDGDETDVDCGGSCPGCDLGQTCNEGGDCESTICSDAGMCAETDLIVWLDALAIDTLFQDASCTFAVDADQQDVQCWENLGSAGGAAIFDTSAPDYDAPGFAVNFSDDLLILDSVFSGDLDDVAVFLVQTEVNGTNSRDFNLDHPNAGDDRRYTSHVPFDSSRRVVFDPGNTSTARVRTEPGLVAIGEVHIYGFINSASKDVRQIFIDAAVEGEVEGAFAAPASNVSVGEQADSLVHEFRIYVPAPGPEEREDIEGDIACRWRLRDELPQDHLYYDPDGNNQDGCP